MNSWTLVFLVCAGGAVLSGCARPSDDLAPVARGADRFLPKETEEITGRIPQRATLASVLREARLREDLIPAMVSVTGAVFDLRGLKADHDFRLERTFTGLLRVFEYEIDNDRFLRVTPAGNRQPEDLKAELVPYHKERALVSVGGEINQEAPSLFEAMDVAGERPDLSVKMADIFSGEIDFNTELQPNDRFRVAFEKVYREGEFCEYGEVLAAEFLNDGRMHKAVRYTIPGGKPGYYDEQGRSLRRFFLKSPLPFQAAVTSHFSKARLHPVLRIVRPHLGVDYRASTGSAVVAVSNGTVVSAGWSGGAGRMVHLRHASGYETLYMHLSSIPSRIRRGAHVSQGELIGRVGSSGLSTGPHLDYRVKINGRFVNPLAVHRSLPPGEPIPAAFMADFQNYRDKALAVLAAPAAGGGQ